MYFDRNRLYSSANGNTRGWEWPSDHLACQISIICLQYAECDRSDVESIQGVLLVPESLSQVEESKFGQAKEGRSSRRVEVRKSRG